MTKDRQRATGNATKASASAAKSPGSVAKVAGPAAKSPGSVVKVAGTAVKSAGSVAKVAGAAVKSEGSVAKVAGSAAKSAGSVAKLARTAKSADDAAKSVGSAGRRERSRAHETLRVDVRETVALITLTRPQIHNAFDDASIAELTRALDDLDADASVRAVVLLGDGKSFCAGADLNWMRRMAGYSHAENIADARRLATMLKTLHSLSKPTIARVHGSSFGGGVGLVACCDVAFAAQDATFALSEAKLGLIPATISPYVIAAIGERYARRYMLSAERFSAAEAFRIGLVHDIYPLDELDARINEFLGALLTAGPHAQSEVKGLIRAVAGRAIDDALIADTAERIARVRGSPEGREGVGAFLEKRAPAWLPAVLRQQR